MTSPWENEPNIKEFEYKGFPCLIVRNESMGFLCGYIGISKDHPWYGEDYKDIPVNVHGDLTFSKKGGENDKWPNPELWWIGFDCGHSGDLIPYGNCFDRLFCQTFSVSTGKTDKYRNIKFVENQIKKLADQIIKKDGGGS